MEFDLPSWGPTQWGPTVHTCKTCKKETEDLTGWVGTDQCGDCFRKEREAIPVEERLLDIEKQLHAVRAYAYHHGHVENMRFG